MNVEETTEKKRRGGEAAPGRRAEQSVGIVERSRRGGAIRPSLLGFALVTSIASAHAQKAFTPRQIADLYQDSVVGIRTTTAAGVTTGTGFFYKTGTTIATSYHVIKGATRIEVVRRDGKIWNPVLIAYDEDADVALIEFDWNTGRRPIPHSPSDSVGAGDPVVTIGDPLGLSFSVSTGIVAALRSDAGIREIQFTAPISHGSSGGPVIDAQGRAIGIVRSTIVDGQNLNLAVSTAHAYRLFQEASTLVPFSTRVKSAKDFYKMWSSVPEDGLEAVDIDTCRWPSGLPIALRDFMSQGSVSITPEPC